MKHEKPVVKHRLRYAFRRIAEHTSRYMGSPFVFLLAMFFIIVWVGSGFYMGFNEKWQLIINTGTTIATFLMVILIQNTQYREARSTQLKLNELLFGTKNTRDSFLEIEEESEEELDLLKLEFAELRQKYIERLNKKKQR
ncbi:MAG TPA: low affinity iron permease family protein [Chlamydiales bacterium]|nr:low affinity iron permease family protein [Chlamydiales bacterium]